MAYKYEITYRHQEYMPRFKWMDKVERPPEEYRKIYLEWIKKHPLFPHRHNPLIIGTKAMLISRHKVIYDMFNGPAGPCCSQKFKDLVDELEPDIHEFIPISLYWKNGEQIDGSFYLFSMLQVLDTMIPEKSSIEWRKMKDRDYFYWCETEPPIREYFTLDAKAIEGKHLWWEEKVKLSMELCSDTFHDEFQKRDLKCLEFKKISEA